MKLYIPEIGDQIVLSNDWTFNLHREYRNISLIHKIGETLKGGNNLVTIPKGTSLKIDRIYIRKGNSDYSSLTFYIGSGEWKGGRFWAKLKDVNNIEFDEVTVTVNIKVQPNMSITSSLEGNIVKHGQLNNWKDRFTKTTTCLVDKKSLVRIRVDYELQNLTEEECNLLNAPKHGYVYYRNNYSLNDVKVIKYNLIASLISNDEILGTARTTTTLVKKIKEYFQKHPELIAN